MKKFWAWAALFCGIAYFALPLIGMTDFSLKMRRGEYSFDAYAKVLADPRFQETFTYSVAMAIAQSCSACCWLCQQPIGCG
jgi:putative spermidine/putrescine transport system permease protein